MDRIKALEEFGLEEREAKIYIKLLELNNATVSKLAQKTTILRPTLYDVLDKMLQKGVISYSKYNGKKVFSAVRPETLGQIIETKKQLIEDIIPELKAIAKTNELTSKVETFIGSKGLKGIYDDILITKKPLYHILNSATHLDFFKEYFIQNFLKKRVERNIRFKVLLDKKVHKVHSTNPKELREVRMLKELAGLDVAIFFYGEKAGFFSFGETPTGVVIENKLFANTLKIMFNISGR